MSNPTDFIFSVRYCHNYFYTSITLGVCENPHTYTLPRRRNFLSDYQGVCNLYLNHTLGRQSGDTYIGSLNFYA